MIIGLCGEPGVGRRTLALQMSVMHGYKRVPFNMPIMRMLSVGFNLNAGAFTAEYEHLSIAEEGVLAARTPASMVKRLRDWYLQLGPDALIEQAERARAGFDRVIFEDVSNVREAEYVLKIGGKLIEITKRGVGGHNHGVPREHISMTVVNDGTLRDLREKGSELHKMLEDGTYGR